MSKVNLKDALNKVLDRTDLDEKVLKELKAIKTKVEKLEDQAEAKIEDLLEEPKSFVARLKATFGFWSIIEIGTLAFMALPAWNGDYNVAFGAALVWVLLHKFNKNWIK
jgi:hypothetical protein